MSVPYEQYEEHSLLHGDASRLSQLRNELGAIGGAGEFFGNDKVIGFGGVRDSMEEEELRNVLKLLSFGETKINLKGREF